nr:Scr1 family TA system antitoxin-like transcriptional regulator [Parafrankia elaeagni]
MSLHRLIGATREPHITIQLIPHAAGAHAGMQGAFIILDFPNPADPTCPPPGASEGAGA